MKQREKYRQIDLVLKKSPLFLKVKIMCFLMQKPISFYLVQSSKVTSLNMLIFHANEHTKPLKTGYKVSSIIIIFLSILLQILTYYSD